MSGGALEVLVLGAVAYGVYRFTKKPEASDFQTMGTTGAGGTPVKVATPVPDHVTPAQATGTPASQTVGTPAPVPTTVPGTGTIYAPPHTIDATRRGGVAQAAPIVVTPTGASSVAVGSTRDVQRALNALGIRSPEHGYHDDATTDAIKAFQAKRGMVASGVAGPPVKSALSAALTALAGSNSAAGLTAQNSLPATGAATSPNGTTLDVRAALRMTVREVQHALNALGISPPLRETGVIGPPDVAAIKTFQTTSGLIPDGVAGPKTRTALWLAVGGASSNLGMGGPFKLQTQYV